MVHLSYKARCYYDPLEIDQTSGYVSMLTSEPVQDKERDVRLKCQRLRETTADFRLSQTMSRSPS